MQLIYQVKLILWVIDNDNAILLKSFLYSGAKSYCLPKDFYT